MKCYQCQNPAVYAVGEEKMPLCLHCYHKYQQILSNQNAENERMINYLRDMMEWTVGIPTNSPRFPERKPPIINNMPTTLNSINIDRSIVGNVNTGYIDNLEISMQSVSQQNGYGAEMIKKFTEAILKEEKLAKGQKEEIIQQLEFLGQQLNIAIEKRNSGVIKSILNSIVSLINFSASLMTLWEPIGHLFK